MPNMSDGVGVVVGVGVGVGSMNIGVEVGVGVGVGVTPQHFALASKICCLRADLSILFGNVTYKNAEVALVVPRGFPTPNGT